MANTPDWNAVNDATDPGKVWAHAAELAVSIGVAPADWTGRDEANYHEYAEDVLVTGSGYVRPIDRELWASAQANRH